MGIEQIDEAVEERALGNREELVREIASVLNRRSRENVSNTPDFILAEHMVQSLESFEATSRTREGWYGTSLVPGQGIRQSTGFQAELTVDEVDDLIAEAGPGCEEIDKRLRRAQKGDRLD